MAKNQSHKVDTITHDVENAGFLGKKATPEKLSPKLLSLKLVANIWVLFSIIILIAYGVLAPRFVFLNYTGSKPVIDGAPSVTFKTSKKAKIVFEYAEESSVSIIRGQYKLLEDNGHLTFKFIYNAFPFSFTEILIRSRDFSKTKFIFLCAAACHISTRFPAGSRLDFSLNVKSPEGYFLFENVNFLSLIIESNMGSLYMKNSALGDSVLVLADFQVIMVNDAAADYAIYQYSTNAILLAHEDYNKHSTVVKGSCPLYSDCYLTNLYSQKSISDLKGTTWEAAIQAFIYSAKFSLMFLSKNDYYSDFLYTFDQRASSPRVIIFVRNSKLIVVPPVIYNSQQRSSFVSLELFDNQNIDITDFEVVSLGESFEQATAIRSNTIYITDLNSDYAFAQKAIGEMTSKFLRLTHQDQFFFINVVPFNVELAFVRSGLSHIVLDHTSLAKSFFTGVYENIDVCMPITSTSFSSSNNFFNILDFALGVQRQLNERTGSPQYELMVKINNPEMAEVALGNAYFPADVYNLKEQLLSDYNLVQPMDGSMFYFWPLVDTHIKAHKVLIYIFKLAFCLIPLLVCIKLHYEFLSRSIDYFNGRRRLLNKLLGTRYAIEPLPKNCLHRMANAILFMDYNQVIRYYYFSTMERRRSSLSRFCEVIFTIQVKPRGAGPEVGERRVSLKKFNKIYGEFCFINDLPFEEIDHFVSEAKFKDFNHTVVNSKETDCYINGLKVISQVDLGRVQEDLSHNADSLDLFINFCTHRIADASTKLGKFASQYDLFCAKNDIEPIKVNSEYLSAKYQFEIVQKTKAYIHQTASQSLRRFYTLNGKYFKIKQKDIRELRRALVDSDREDGFREGLVRALFKLIGDLLLFQYLLMMLFYSVSQIEMTAVMAQLYSDITFPYEGQTSDILMFMGLYIAYSIFTQAIERPLIDSPMVAGSVPRMVLFSVAWLYIYYQKFVQFYYLLDNFLDVLIGLAFFQFQLNNYDILLAFFVGINCLWAAHFVIRGRVIRRFDESSLSLIRMRSLQYIQSASKDGLTDKQDEDTAPSDIRETFENMHNLRELIRGRAEMQPDQYETLTGEFFAKLELRISTPLYKLLMAILHRHYDVRTITERLMDVNDFYLLAPTESEPFPEKLAANIQQSTAAFRSFLIEFVIARVNKASIFSRRFLSLAQKIARVQLPPEQSECVSNMLEFFFANKPTYDSEALGLERFVRVDDTDREILALLKALLGQSSGSPSPLLLSSPASKAPFLPSKPAQSHEMCRRARTCGEPQDFGSDHFKYSRPLPVNELKILHEHINEQWQSEAEVIKESTLATLQSLKAFRPNIWSHYFSEFLDSKDESDILNAVAVFLLFMELVKDTSLYKLYSPILEKFENQKFIVFLCGKLEMRFREMLGMIFMVSGIDTEYNEHFIAYLCRLYKFDKRRGFCMFAYSLLNYKDVSEVALIESQIPEEFIKIFVHFQSKVTAIKAKTIRRVISQLEVPDKSLERVLYDILESGDVSRYQEFREQSEEFTESASPSWKLLDFVIELSNPKRDRWSLFESMSSLFNGIKRDKSFLTFFKQLFTLMSEISQPRANGHRKVKGCTQKFAFIFPRQQKAFKYFEVLFSDFSIINSNIVMVIARKTYPRNMAAENSNAIARIDKVIKKRLEIVKSTLGHFESLKRHLSRDSSVPHGKLIGALLEDLLIDRTRYTPKASDRLINQAFFMLVESRQASEIRSAKLIEFFACLYKSLLAHKAAYLCHYFEKHHPNSTLMPILLSIHFKEEVATKRILSAVESEMTGLNRRQEALVQFYLSALHPNARKSSPAKLVYTALGFEPSLSYIIDVSIGLKGKVTSVTASYDQQAKDKVSAFIGSSSVNLLVAVIKSSDDSKGHCKGFTNYSDFIINLIKVKKSFEQSQEVLSRKALHKILETPHCMHLLSLLRIKPKEARILLAFAFHLYNEEDVLVLLDWLKINPSEYRFLSNLLFVKKQASWSKACSDADVVIFHSAFFTALRYNPLISWLVVFSLKKDYYAVCRLMLGKIAPLKSSTTFKFATNLMLYSITGDANSLLRTSNAKVVNCQSYHFWKLCRIEPRFRAWLATKQHLLLHFSPLLEARRHFTVVLCHLLVQYNLNEESQKAGRDFFSDLVRSMCRWTAGKVVKKTACSRDNADYSRMREILKLEKGCIRDHHGSSLRQKLAVDVGQPSFLHYCYTEFKLPLFQIEPERLRSVFNRAMIKGYIKSIESDLACQDARANMQKCLRDEKLCCWHHPLTDLNEQCIRQLFLYRPCYDSFQARIGFLVMKKARKMSRVSFGEGQWRRAPKKDADGCAGELFTAHVIVQALTKRLIKLSEISQPPTPEPSKMDFIAISKLLVLAAELCMYCLERKLFRKFEKNLLLKFIRLIFLKFGGSAEAFTRRDKMAPKFLYHVYNSPGPSESGVFFVLLGYFRTIWSFKAESEDQAMSPLPPISQDSTGIPHVVQDEVLKMRHAKRSIKQFITQCSFSQGKLAFLKTLCDYECTYLKAEFETEPKASPLFPQASLNKLMLFLDVKSTFTSFERFFLKSDIAAHFQSRPKNLIDLTKYLVRDYQAGMFEEQLGNSAETNKLCDILLSGGTSFCSWIEFNISQGAIDYDFGLKFGKLIRFVKNPEKGDFFIDLGLMLYRGDNPQVARLRLEKIQQLTVTPDGVRPHSLIRQSMALLPEDFVSSAELDRVETVVQIVCGTLHGNLAFLRDPSDDCLQAFHENLGFDNVQVLRIFDLINAVSDRRVSEKSTCSVLHEFISFGQYDLTRVDLDEARHILVMLKFLMTRNYNLLIDILRRDGLKKEHNAFLATFLYINRELITRLDRHRPEYQILIRSATDFIFAKILRANFSDRANDPDFEQLTLSLVNLERTLGQTIYNFDAAKLAFCVRSLCHEFQGPLPSGGRLGQSSPPAETLTLMPDISPEIRLIYSFFVDAPLSSTTGIDMRPYTTKRPKTLEAILKELASSQGKYDSRLKPSILRLFDSHALKFERLFTYATLRKQILASVFDNRPLTFELKSKFVALLKQFHANNVHTDWHKVKTISEFILRFHYESQWNRKIYLIMEFLQSFGVVYKESIEFLASRFDGYDFDFVFRLICKLMEYRDQAAPRSRALFADLSIFLGGLRIPEDQIRLFFYMFDVLSKDRALFSSWFASTAVSSPFFSAQKSRYGQSVREQRFISAPLSSQISLLRRLGLENMRCYLDQGLAKDPKAFNSALFKFIDRVYIEKDRNSDSFMQPFLVFYGFSKSARFVIKSYFRTQKLMHHNPGGVVSKIQFEHFNADIQQALAKSLYRSQGRYWLLSSTFMFLSSMIFFFADYVLITLRFGIQLTEYNLSFYQMILILLILRILNRRRDSDYHAEALFCQGSLNLIVKLLDLGNREFLIGGIWRHGLILGRV